jgi:hypothetical protein
MTAEAEVVKARFGAQLNNSAAAAMTTDARVSTAAIREVVMTLDAVHCAVLVVRKVNDQPLTTAEERFTQRQSCAASQQCEERDERAKDNCQHEPRMPSERESAEEVPPVLSRLSLGARTQQGEQHDAREQYVCDRVRAAVDVTIRSQYVHRQSDHQQAGRADMGGLKVPVARPDSPADRRTGRHGKKEQREERQDPRVFITGGRQLDMLDNAMIDAEQ